jgi:hypothetical protein
VLNQDGSAQLSGHFHDSGFPSYKTAAAWVVTDDFGNVYTFGAQGSVQGTEAGFSPNRDWNYNAPGWNAGITQAWNQLRDARPTWKAQANVDVGALIQDIIQGIGEVQTVIAVIALA